MGFYKSRRKCNACGEKWNTLFVSVPPMQMPRIQCHNLACLSNDTVKTSDDWNEPGLLSWSE